MGFAHDDGRPAALPQGWIQEENHGVAGGLWGWLSDSDGSDGNLDITYCCVRFIRKMACKKLTLSVPESTIRKAKVFAKRRNMSVSKLFSESIEKLAVLESEDPKLEAENPDLFAFLGVAESRLSAFDERSESILGKHG